MVRVRPQNKLYAFAYNVLCAVWTYAYIYVWCVCVWCAPSLRVRAAALRRHSDLCARSIRRANILRGGWVCAYFCVCMHMYNKHSCKMYTSMCITRRYIRTYNVSTVPHWTDLQANYIYIRTRRRRRRQRWRWEEGGRVEGAISYTLFIRIAKDWCCCWYCVKYVWMYMPSIYMWCEITIQRLSSVSPHIFFYRSCWVIETRFAVGSRLPCVVVLCIIASSSIRWSVLCV